MTTGLKTPSNYYLQLINTFPPRPINNEVELIATQSRIDSILDKKNITQDDKDYLKVLGTLVYYYEEEHEPMPIFRGIELLKALMKEENLKPHNLVSIFGNESTVTKILEKNKKLPLHKFKKLAIFSVSLLCFF